MKSKELLARLFLELKAIAPFFGRFISAKLLAMCAIEEVFKYGTSSE